MSTLPAQFIPLFERTTWIVNEQAKDLTHADSLIQPPFRGNCFNWVLGHLTEGRDRMLTALGLPTCLSEDETDFYKRGSEPITAEAITGSDEPQAIPLPDLLRTFNDQHDRLVDHFQQASPESLAEIAFPERGTSVGEWVAFLHWHETYHVGQLELLRQLSGVDDAVIR